MENARRAMRHLQRAQELLEFGSNMNFGEGINDDKDAKELQLKPSWLNVHTSPPVSITFDKSPKELLATKFDNNILIVGMSMENLRTMVKQDARVHFFQCQNDAARSDRDDSDLRDHLEREKMNIETFFEELEMFLGKGFFHNPVHITCVDPYSFDDHLHMKHEEHIISFFKQSLSTEHFNNKNIVIVRPSTIHFIENWYELKSTYTEKKPTFYFVGASKADNIDSLLSWTLEHHVKPNPDKPPNVLHGMRNLFQTRRSLILSETNGVWIIINGSTGGLLVTIYDKSFFERTENVLSDLSNIPVYYIEQKGRETRVIQKTSALDYFKNTYKQFRWEHTVPAIKNLMEKYSMFDMAQVYAEQLPVTFEHSKYKVFKVSFKESADIEDLEQLH